MPPTIADISVEVIIDSSLSARAIAGSSRVRLRTGAMYSELDLDQLLEHEAHIMDLIIFIVYAN